MSPGADGSSVRLVAPGAPHLALLAVIHGACFESGWSAETFAEMIILPGTIAWLALDGEQPVGMMLARVAADEGEILTLAVVPEARGRGIARLLLDRALSTAREAGSAMMFLEVAATNEAALRLYRGAGFRMIGHRREYYRLADGRGEDAIVMRKDF